MNRLKIAVAVAVSSVLLTFVYFGLNHIGYNMTDSIPFTFYYHTDLEAADLKKGFYVLFTLPNTPLYKSGLKVVKRIACSEGDYLRSVLYEDRAEYYCDGVLVSTATVFTSSKGEPLEIFEYDGVVPPGYAFVLGLEDRSYDSRYWGLLPVKNVLRAVHPLTFDNSAEAAELPAANGFYADRNKGWYKYEIVPKEETVEPDNETAPPSSAETAVLIKPSIPWERVSMMPVKEFAKLFENVQDYAMTYRTLENFDDYAKLRTVMFKRSVEFMNVAALWGQLHPEDSSEDWFPSSGFGQAAYQAEADAIRKDYIRRNSNNFGLLYFYRPDCAYCGKQTPLIRYFEDVSGWEVKAVNVDEIPESVLRFNVKSVPALILVERETERFFPVSAGLMTYEEIEERLYRTIKYLRGESDEKTFSDPVRPDNLVKR